MADEKFSLGDVVRLKTGNIPEMVVNEIHLDTRSNGSVCTCVWFDGRERKEGKFNDASLEKAEPPDGKYV